MSQPPRLITFLLYMSYWLSLFVWGGGGGGGRIFHGAGTYIQLDADDVIPPSLPLLPPGNPPDALSPNCPC